MSKGELGKTLKSSAFTTLVQQLKFLFNYNIKFLFVFNLMLLLGKKNSAMLTRDKKTEQGYSKPASKQASVSCTGLHPIMESDSV